MSLSQLTVESRYTVSEAGGISYVLMLTLPTHRICRWESPSYRDLSVNQVREIGTRHTRKLREEIRELEALEQVKAHTIENSTPF